TNIQHIQRNYCLVVRYDMSETKKPMTDKQKASRLANLKKGRETRMANIKNKKNNKTEDEYESSSEDSESSSSDVDFVLSKRKPTKKQDVKTRSRDECPKFTPHNEFNDLKMVAQLAQLQKS